MTTTYLPLASAVLPRKRAVTIALVVGFALLTAAAAQFKINLPSTPVPITGQTFAVLLAGGVLGSRAGAASQALYWMLGLLFPFYADGGSGWKVASGATGGYLVGFIVAAWAVGFLAERGQDRSVASAMPAFLAGTVIIYAFGVPWLAAELDVSWQRAMELGAVPFIIGDLAKVALAGLLLPGAWQITGKRRLARH
ncbi:MAG: biotin transporter BioY [Acidimicrobiia bacterium]|nr:biotin transporter BioY [Acidimicrobiia bacterium]